MSGNRGFSARPTINVTPMIDILLVLLILFMVIAPIAPRIYAAKTPLPPPKDEKSRVDETTLLVTLAADGTYRLNNVSLSGIAELETELRRALDGRPADRCEVYVRAPRSLRYGEVIRVIDAIKRAGANPIGMIVDQLDS